MSKPKPVAASRAEFFTGDVPPPVVKHITKAISTETPSEASVDIDLPRNKGLVLAQEVPADDDPGALLRQLTAGMPPGALRPEEIANEAERARHNAHVESLRMIDMEQRRQRRARAQDQGKPKRGR